MGFQMREDTRNRYEHLKKNLKLYGRAAVAFSGGLSSAFLLRTAQNVLGTDDVLAITAISMSFPEEERLRSQALVREWGIKQIFVETEFWKEASKYNSNRCKACRDDLFDRMLKIALERGFDLLLEGSCSDDPVSDARIGTNGGMLVRPLAQVGLTKQHLREIAQFEGLSIYDLPSNSCLLSRFPPGQSVTPVDLARVDKAETLLRNLGFSQVRVRDHGDVARIEVNPDEWVRFEDHRLREMVYIGLKNLGYAYSALDIKGYRPGSMNEIVDKAN